ncbi:alpha/beta hydrolase [Mycobacterium sp. NPDC051804]|uniref:alpha/beta hydrolase n=1 Tax=Mycobacterium sp. NPDC051804 TaxID=3364295 RepID=UPI00378F38F5
MTSSLPVQTEKTPTGGKARLVKLGGTSLRALPHIPRSVKRVLLGGRSVVIDGNTLDTTLQFMLFGQNRLGLGSLILDPDVPTARALLRMLTDSFRQDIPVASVTNLVIPGSVGAIRARHYRPISGDGAPLLVFFHGGAMVVGDLETHDDACRQICREGGMHVLSVDYRLAPEHKAPASVDDAFTAFTWALDHAAELGADVGRVAVGGDSAGANLAALVSLRARDEGVQLPALQLLFYPVTEWNAQTRSRTLFGDGFFLTRGDLEFGLEKYIDGADVDAADPRVSPLLVDDLSGLPPALVLTAGFDPLRDEGRQYADALRAAGVEVDYREFQSLIHGFLNFFPVGGDSATAIAESISALRAHLART